MAKPVKDTNSIADITTEEFAKVTAKLEGWAVRTHDILEDILLKQCNVVATAKKYDVSRQYIYKTVSRFNAVRNELKEQEEKAKQA